MPNYSNGKIYVIRFIEDDNNIYVGSTIQPLSVRFANHKRNTDCSLYQYVETKYYGNWSNCYIELFENYPCENKEQLNRREGEVIRDIGTINKRIEGRTLKEYYIDNKDKILEKAKEYNINNAEKIKEQMKEYYINNAEKRKEQMKEYRIDNADKIKQYRIDNADKIKQYYENNKDKIKDYYVDNKDKIKEKIICDCGFTVCKNSLERHKKTQKHIKFMNAI